MCSSLQYRNGIRNNKGGTTLSLLFSTIGGALFLFTFYNLTQYTAARSGAEQAARRAARCLSPSDPECKTVVPAGVVGNPVATWFGFQPAFGPTSVTADTFRYTGEVTEEIYTAEYNSYEVNTSNHQVIWDEEEVRPQRFVGLLNSYANLMADVSVYVAPIAGGPEKVCRLNDVVNLPAGIDFSESTYFNTKWCSEFLQGDALLPGARIASAGGCNDVTNGLWKLSPGADRSNSYCSLSIPSPRSAGDSPWLLLGGKPICDSAPESPSESLAQSLQELNQQFRNKGFKDPEPGDKQIRPYPITPSRQFLVVEAFSCNPGSFLAGLESMVKSTSSLKSFVNSSGSVDLPRFNDLPPLQRQDFLTSPSDPTDVNSFIYQGLSGVSFIAEQDWTYIEWSRRADGLRRLSREVCTWLPWDQAVAKWPELATYDSTRGVRYRNTSTGTSYYQSGNQYGPEIPVRNFAKAPSCLNPVDANIQPYFCANREIAGQPGGIGNCGGWNTKEASLEKTFQDNYNFALNLNGNSKYKILEDLPLNFEFDTTPQFGSGLLNQVWEPSWSNQKYGGVTINVPNSVRARGGYNPKTLPESLHASQLKRKDDSLAVSNQEKLIANIKINEGTQSLEGWAEAVSTFKFNKIDSLALKLNGSWPFISDHQGAAIPQLRPYVYSSAGSPYDYNLDCSPDAACTSGNAFSTLEEALRSYGNNSPQIQGKGNLTDSDVNFIFTEQPAGSTTMSVDQAKTMPMCSQFFTTCGIGGAGNVIQLGSSNGPPAGCLNGTYVNCYPEYGAGDVGTQDYRVDTNFQLARDKAMGEIRKLVPQAVECADAVQANCVAIDITELNGRVDVNVQFVAPLTYPFNSILASDTLLVKGSTSELLETDRLKTN